ncbi:hypothetical protein F5883DRAFT_637854 [Diaporthe sp. PMI_573]|nr:hypothetical protein F5883DRAFT_637854 [Diaporthaceae sp. PMI_573]
MDSTPVGRCAECVQEFLNPHFRPLWEPDTTIGRNAITYSLVHHVYQKRISNAGLCGFCTDELTRRVSEVARRFKSKGLFHDEKASMDLFWQDKNENNGVGLVAGETIVVFGEDGEKLSLADHAEELSLEKSAAWWNERGLRFQSEIAAMDRSEAVGSREASWLGRLGRRDSGRSEATPWETRFVGTLWSFMGENTEKISMATFVDLQEKYLNFTHENCQCLDTLRLRNGVSFETVLMERVLNRIGAKVWEVIPMPSEDVWRNRGRFLTYFSDQSSGIRNEESVWDYAYSSGEVHVGEKRAPGVLPPGWQQRCEYANTVCYYDCHGLIISRDGNQPRPSSVPYAYESYTVDEENLIEL